MAATHNVSFENDSENKQQARCSACGVIFTAAALARRNTAGTVLLAIAALALAALVLGLLLVGLTPVQLIVLVSIVAAGSAFGLICRDSSTVLDHGQPRPPMGRC